MEVPPQQYQQEHMRCLEAAADEGLIAAPFVLAPPSASRPPPAAATGPSDAVAAFIDEPPIPAAAAAEHPIGFFALDEPNSSSSSSGQTAPADFDFSTTAAANENDCLGGAHAELRDESLSSSLPLASGSSGPRTERSNSCSQAGAGSELGLLAGADEQQAASTLLLATTTAAALAAATTTSQSHENLSLAATAPSDGSGSGAVELQVTSVETQAPASTAKPESQKQGKQQQQQKEPGRFFSSKLNTGSLWSLLSAGSASSMQDLLMGEKSPQEDQQQQRPHQEEQAAKSNESHHLSGFFGRQVAAPPKRQMSAADSGESQPSDPRRRFRFQLKYVGSAMLHKNFTLPMLEWIAKDIKRQTIRGAQSVASQRQFTIPARDILFEIQPQQLTAVSCKDGHRLFVHPMHCVSKYAQLQQEPTCFSYLIRDTKEAPTFCHVFQAKSPKRVHEVFNAIREVAAEPPPPPPTNPHQARAGLQRSASGELPGSCHHRKLPDIISVAAQGKTTDSSAQFENSYQFEVMFVKKVKLQCRRVPATFVDDALETLRSFDVLKGTHADKAKGSCLGKRIISASVDERQEYDELAQQEQPHHHLSSNNQQHEQPGSASLATVAEQRRSSSGSLHKQAAAAKDAADGGGGPPGEGGTRSCQQSPIKASPSSQVSPTKATAATTAASEKKDNSMKKHLSIDCLSSLADLKMRNDYGEEDQQPYCNDFSPYNTITSSDLNKRIAAIPVVSNTSVSLDHETRQKLARQVRETIMATAVNIKRGMYGSSGERLDSASKALDSLTCSLAPPAGSHEDAASDASTPEQPRRAVQPADEASRRGSAPTTNNFDLFRRASARQVVKNRTMLLLIGQDELCTISIDKHQMLFNMSFSSILHCLQGNNNKDHFGLICRDMGKINPLAENYAGFIFKCQSDKVVREIMGALKQVIYSSQHNYHGFNSPYNPLTPSVSQVSPKFERAGSLSAKPAALGISTRTPQDGSNQVQQQRQQLSLAYKRGFTSYPIELDEAASRSSAAVSSSPQIKPLQQSVQQQQQPKNLIKSMFCDDCPLYWYHRLCCDIESLSAEASKAIILRRIDSSLSEREQDELYSKFSEFNIDSVGEHNEIFMSLLRHLCERKQLKHSQQHSHLLAMAKNSARPTPAKYPAATSSHQTSSIPPNHQLQFPSSDLMSSPSNPSMTGGVGGHQRTGSSGGSLALMMGQSGAAANQSLADASSAAFDNFKKAKNSISSSIENLLKRRSSCRDDFDHQIHSGGFGGLGGLGGGGLASRPGSFKGPSSSSSSSSAASSKSQQTPAAAAAANETGFLRRSQSTTQQPEAASFSSGGAQTPLTGSATTHWRNPFLARYANVATDDSTNPLVGLFKRRNSGSSNSTNKPTSEQEAGNADHPDDSPRDTAERPHPNSPTSSGSMQESRFLFPAQHQSVLTSGFWKKSIFDKIRQPLLERGESSESQANNDHEPLDSHHLTPATTTTTDRGKTPEPTKRSREELRLLWKKAIIEQITLIKMEKQNQRLQVNAAECDVQRVKLNYKDVTYPKDVPQLWDRLLKQDPTKKVEFKEVARLVRRGVPKSRRGEIWMFLMNQFQLRHGSSFKPADSDYHGDCDQNYRSLLTQLSVQQHEIFSDIGRTFPSHPYYSQYLSIGQLSLFNLLKAYSLLDPEVGYCQGLSFVAGILLLHVNTEDEAFELMRHFLFNFGLRKQYLPSMNALHLQLYQITRLLRDHEYELFNHFDHYDISPSLYAAPWFLTLFASQFPLGFVARLFDLISLIGIEAIFRVSLNLLSLHKASILVCESLESTMEYMRQNLVRLEDKSLVDLFDKSMSMDLRIQLIEYEIEYQLLNSARHTATTSPVPQDNNGSMAAETTPAIDDNNPSTTESTSVVANAAATIILQHILANSNAC